MMPEPNGIETFNIIRSDTTNPNCKTPVVVVTANAGIDVETEYMSIGFSDYIAKPIDVNKLESVLVKYLR
jgi:CheY-like chemotaxis protein